MDSIIRLYDTALPAPWRDVVLAAAVLLLLVLAARTVRHGRRDAGRRDPQRAFTPTQRHDGFARAGNRCEYDRWFGLGRCTRTAGHGDHFYPWTSGGATSMANFVAACAHHNLSKGARQPTGARARRIARRRRRYFPHDTPVRPGQWYGRPPA